MDPRTIPHRGPAPADLLIADLVNEVLELRIALDDARDDLTTYRAFVQVTLAQLHALTVQNWRLTDRCRDQNRQIADLLRLDEHEAAA